MMEFWKILQKEAGVLITDDLSINRFFPARRGLDPVKPIGKYLNYI